MWLLCLLSDMFREIGRVRRAGVGANWYVALVELRGCLLPGAMPCIVMDSQTRGIRRCALCVCVGMADMWF
jgi:hypothetical protein